jgi:ATP-dependent Clp protease ATP-binding subunit ClpA
MLLLNGNITTEVNDAVHIAQRIATDHFHSTYGCAHLLKALLHKNTNLHNLLVNMDKDVYYMEDWADARIEHYPKSNQVPEPDADEEAQAVMNEADYVRIKLHKDKIDAVCLLAAISTPGVGFTFDQLKTFPVRRDDFLNTLPDVDEMIQDIVSSGTDQQQAKKTVNAVAKYCIQKNKQLQQKEYSIVGRDKELRLMCEILGRHTKPNILMIGEPGTGKTALLNGFTQAVLKKAVPPFLQNITVYELDNASLLSGAGYKGEAEDRLKSILQELKQQTGVVLFIDEIHILLDKSGIASGIVNILKPVLATGELTLIAATTTDAYRKHIEPDEAFNRCFELLKIEEPDDATAFRMMKHAMPGYIQHHKIEMSDEVMQECIRLAKRYLKERKLPDAAIDLADRSMAALRLMNDTGKHEIEKLEAQLNEAIQENEKAAASIESWHWLCRQLQNKISPILLTHIQSEINPLQLETVDAVKDYLSGAIAELKKAVEEPHNSLLKPDIASVVSSKTGIPAGKLQSQERERLLNMEATLKQRVVGQDHAIKSIADAILESRSGMGKPGQPVGSFFFLGPTGTGKTELAKSLAEFLFQSESFMIRFDMSEFKEEHAAALLYGAPPGYVGYEEGGLLVNKIRQQPYAVVLFDEIEKAHSSVFDVFLQIMDEGKLHDKLGKEGDFSNAVVIFTSNIGSQFVVDEFNKGSIPSSSKLMEVMNNYFRPEFLGRLTEIIPFAPMKQEMVRNILDIQLKTVYQALEKQGIQLNISEKAKDSLANMGFTPAYGARPLATVIRNLVRRPLSGKIIKGELKHGSIIELDVSDDKNFKWVLKKQKQAGRNT